MISWLVEAHVHSLCGSRYSPLQMLGTARRQRGTSPSKGPGGERPPRSACVPKEYGRGVSPPSGHRTNSQCPIRFPSEREQIRSGSCIELDHGRTIGTSRTKALEPVYSFSSSKLIWICCCCCAGRCCNKQKHLNAHMGRCPRPIPSKTGRVKPQCLSRMFVGNVAS
jgi:hypothetical protein